MAKGMRWAIIGALLVTLAIIGISRWGRGGGSRAVSDRESPEAGQPVSSPGTGSPKAGNGAAHPESPGETERRVIEAYESQPRIGGRVEARDGTGVPGVHVVAVVGGGKQTDHAVTDADGRYEFSIRGRARIGIARFERLRKTPLHDIQVEDGGMGTVLTFEGIAGTATAGDGSLLTRGVILARFVGEDAIAANAPVSKSGSFAFPRLQPGRYLLTYKTHVYGSEYEMTDGGVDLEEWRTGIELRLADGATIEGFVFEGSGAPKPGVWVRATHGTALTGGSSDAEGRFRINGLVPGRTYRLTLWLKGHVPEQREIRAGERDVRFTLDPGLQSSGRLVGPEGKAVAGRQLTLRSASGLSLSSYPTTDANGAFEVGGLPDERIEVLVVQGTQTSCGTFRAGERDVELTVPSK